MQPVRVHRMVFALVGVTAGAALAMLSCTGAPLTAETCPAEQPSASINVAGTYRYAGDSIFLLRGTITFVQEGELVHVTGVTYDNSGDRDLVSDPTRLEGNRLGMLLRPKNGDPDYRAIVTFIFTEDGDEFCVEFNDTNGDAGPLGTYRGTRISLQ